MDWQTAVAIRDRLEAYILERYGSRYKFKQAGWPPSTVEGWLGKDPRTPETPHLLRLATEENLNLNYVLLGEGPMLREAPAPRDDIVALFREKLVAELRSAEKARSWQIGVLVPQAEVLFQAIVREYRARLADLRRNTRSSPVGRQLALLMGVEPSELERQETPRAELEDFFDRLAEGGLSDETRP